MSLETINKIDGEGRCYGIDFHISHNEGQGNSHGASYRELRDMYKSIGENMGFEMNLEKIILGQKAIEGAEGLYLHINTYLDMKEEHCKKYLGSKTMRTVYNMCIEDIANISDTSKNVARKNIAYVSNYRKYDRF